MRPLYWTLISRYLSTFKALIGFGADTLIRQVQLNAWFDSLVTNPSGVASLEDLIMFDNNNPTLEEPTGYTDQSM
jgi:hypothetical protein